MKRIGLIVCLIFTLSICYMCRGTKNPVETTATNTDFQNYWYQGKAEITSYELTQARYGELHKGNAAIVFVTEPFSSEKQVKLDNPSDPNKVDVLKMNLTKKFNTGIYPYSLMQSTFTPINFRGNERMLKASASSQEWCGHTFSQLNLQEGQYNYQLFSYFESESDQEYNVKGVISEDEIWSQVRLNPEILPVGKFQILPGMLYTRLRHRKFIPVQAEAKNENFDDELMVYHIDFLGEARRLSIFYKKEFPHLIERWEDEYVSGFYRDSHKMKTIAIKKKTIMSDYWNKNTLADSTLRKELFLD
ncbi:MAG: septum formation inhibitor Maf [Flavobacteriales bacterium]|nr:septum formation inhibitor Maf [Flavobacteriales bacterium]